MNCFRYCLSILLITFGLVGSMYVIPAPHNLDEQNFCNTKSPYSDIVQEDGRSDISSPVTTLGSGESSTELTFPLEGGMDSNESLILPPDIDIQEARFNLTGRPLENVTVSHRHDFTDTVNNSAWKGGFNGTIPDSAPVTYMEDGDFNDADYNNVLLSDDAWAETTLNDGRSPYQMFQFTVNETNITEIYVFFEGLGYYKIGMANYWYNVTLFIYNDSFAQWDIVQKVFDKMPGPDVNLGKIIESDFSDYIGVQNKLYLMATGPNDPNPDSTDEWLRCDRTYINVKTLETIFPSEVSLDIGNDGHCEWSEPGKFSEEVLISDNARLAFSLQQIIDNGSGIENIEIPIAVGTATAGTIIIDDIFISFRLKPKNSPPVLSRSIPADLLGFYEDTDEGDDLLNISDFFSDAEHENLSFKITINHGEINASLDPDGFYLDFISQKDFFGKRPFQVKALDPGLDGIWETGDELSCLSNIFNVTVYPTNDAPIIIGINNSPLDPEKIHEGLTLRILEDIPEAFIFQCRDVDEDDLSFSISTNLPSPGKIELIDNSTNSMNIEMIVSATGENVGLFDTILTVSDSNGSIPLSITVNLTLEIKNTNDPPQIIELNGKKPLGHSMNLDVLEREWLNFTLVVVDPDPDEMLTFSCSRTDELGNDEIPTMDFYPNADEMSASFHFLAAQEPGIYPVNFTVKDRYGANDWVEVEITVSDVNENPVPGVVNMQGGKGNLTIDMLAEGFFDPDGDPLIYDWDMGDGKGAYFGLELTRINHTFENSGNYTVTLKLVDGRGGETVVDITLNITAPLDDPLNPDGNESQDDDTHDPNAEDESGSEEKGFKAVGAWILTIFIILLLASIVIFNLLRKKRNDRPKLKIEDNEKVSTQAEECSYHPEKTNTENTKATTQVQDENKVEDADDRAHGS